MSDDKKIVAIYCRVANDEAGDGKTIEVQRKILMEYALEHGYTNCVAYLDNQQSGLDPNRPALVQMNADIEAGKVSAIVVRDASRLWRDFRQAYPWERRMERLGVTVMAADGSLPPPPPTELERALPSMLRGKVKKKRSGKSHSDSP